MGNLNDIVEESRIDPVVSAPSPLLNKDPLTDSIVNGTSLPKEIQDKINKDPNLKKQYDKYEEFIKQEMENEKELEEELKKLEDLKKDKKSKIKSVSKFSEINEKINQYSGSVEFDFAKITREAAKKFCDDKKYHVKKGDSKVNYKKLNDPEVKKKYVEYIVKGVKKVLEQITLDSDNPFLDKFQKILSQNIIKTVGKGLENYVSLKPDYATPLSVLAYLNHKFSVGFEQQLFVKSGLKSITDDSVYKKLEERLVDEDLVSLRDDYATGVALSRKTPSFFKEAENYKN